MAWKELSAGAQIASILVAALVASCASVPRLVPDGVPDDQSSVELRAAGVELQVVANNWHGTPSDLTDHYVPLWVQLSNQGAEAFAVTWASFTLVDEQGTPHAALPPQAVGVPVADPSAMPSASGYDSGASGGRRHRRRSGANGSGLPEGSLVPGSQARGFVVFDRLPTAKHMTLHIQLARTAPGMPPLELNVPFSVKG